VTDRGLGSGASLPGKNERNASRFHKKGEAMSKGKATLVALVAVLALGLSAPTARSAEIEITKVLGVPVAAELHFTHDEVDRISNGAEVPLPAPWGTAFKVVAGTLKTFDRGNGVRVIIPITLAPIVVLPR
jgi:hypothetical protein